MPYNPALPAAGAPLDSAVIRDQLQALFNLINNIVTLTSAQVDSTVTVGPATPASASVTVSGGVLHLSFELPVGADGLMGAPGPPFAQAVVDAVSTVDPFSPAQVFTGFDGTNVHFTFQIPRGMPGEVTNTDLSNAISNLQSNTSNNSNSVATLDTGMMDPDHETLRQKLNELIAALRR